MNIDSTLDSTILPQHPISEKWIAKYMKLAKVLADDVDSCFARQVAVVLISDDNRILSMGYNGAVEKTPHTDTKEYLSHLYTDLLTEEDKTNLKLKGFSDETAFCNKFVGCKICPRRILEIPSSQRLELCPCVHAERNCLASANKSGIITKNSTMYCWCGVPCHECTTQIIQAGIKTIVCLKQTTQQYGYNSASSRWLYKKSNINVIEVNPEKYQYLKKDI